MIWVVKSEYTDTYGRESTSLLSAWLTREEAIKEVERLDKQGIRIYYYTWTDVPVGVSKDY